MEAALILATISQRFQLDLASDRSIEVQPSISLRPKNGIASCAEKSLDCVMKRGRGEGSREHGGIVGVLGLTWLQQQTTTYMQGRIMSLVMFAAVALDPISQATSRIISSRITRCKM